MPNSGGRKVLLRLSQIFYEGVPDSLATPLAPAFATAIARVTLDKQTNLALWWLPPSVGFDTQLPEEPIALIEHFSERLFQRLSAAS